MSGGSQAAALAAPPPTGARGAHVIARGLRREHATGGVVALDGVDLELAAGEFVALAGPSGSGKTTLLSLVGGLDRATAGTVLVDGQPVQPPETDRSRYHREVVGFVFQHHSLLLHLTARGNVELPLIAAGVPAADRAARAAQLLEEVDLGHRLEHRAAHLSGGERQRVAIARALANDPLLLLADEPTGALDSAAAERVLDLIEAARRRRGTTLLVVTHDAMVAARADRVLHLRDGRLVDGPPELRAR